MRLCLCAPPGLCLCIAGLTAAEQQGQTHLAVEPAEACVLERRTAASQPTARRSIDCQEAIIPLCHQDPFLSVIFVSCNSKVSVYTRVKRCCCRPRTRQPGVETISSTNFSLPREISRGWARQWEWRHRNY